MATIGKSVDSKKSPCRISEKRGGQFLETKNEVLKEIKKNIKNNTPFDVYRTGSCSILVKQQTFFLAMCDLFLRDVVVHLVVFFVKVLCFFESSVFHPEKDFFWSPTLR